MAAQIGKVSQNFDPGGYQLTEAPAYEPAAASARPPEVSERDSTVAVPAGIIRERRRVRWIRFAIYEALAIALTVGAVVAGMTAGDDAEPLPGFFRLAPVVGAALATVIPILFFGAPGRRRSWSR